MKKYVLMCLFSATLGGGLASLYTGQTPAPQATAQPVAPVYTPLTEAPRVANDPRQGATTFAAGNRQNTTFASTTRSSSRTDVADGAWTAEEAVNIRVYEQVNRSVVNITTRTVRPDMFFRDVPSEGAGSGSVLDKEGHILTNHHVIEGAREVHVTLHDGNVYDARLVGQDPVNDIAVLKIDAPADTLFPVTPGDSSQLRVGQKIYAIGNPFGLERTLTIGIISSLNRSLPSKTGRIMKQIIQIDAALNRGNSGGPLLDSHGRLIGMNTAIASRTGENTGVGFAIPINTVKRVVPHLIREGRVIRPDIGITRVLETEHGLVVATLSERGPAEQAGIKGFTVLKEQRRRGPFVYETTRIDRSSADLIVAIDGKSVRTVDEMLTIVEGRRPGESVNLTVVRDGGREAQIAVRLGTAD